MNSRIQPKVIWQIDDIDSEDDGLDIEADKMDAEHGGQNKLKSEGSHSEYANRTVGLFARRVSKLAINLGDRVAKNRINKVIFNTPQPRQEWVDGKFVKNNENNDEAWVQLFIDLIYVVLLSALARQLEHGQPSPRLYMKISVIFWMVCLTRQAIDEYSNRFYCHDVVQKYLYFIYTIAVFIQASALQFDYLYRLDHNLVDEHIGDMHSLEASTSTKDGLSEHSKLFTSGFATSVLITRVCLLFMYSIVLSSHKDAPNQFKFDMFRWSVSSLLMVIVVVCDKYFAVPMTIYFLCYFLVVVVELVTWIVSRTVYRKNFVFPVNLETLQARWGVWVMIVIGESIIQLLQSFESLERIYELLKFIGVSLLMLFSIAMQYFDACQVEWYHHALTKSAFAGVSWIWLHVPMTSHLFRMEVWLKQIALAYANNEELSQLHSKWFAVSLGLVSLLITMIRMCNSFPDSSVSFVDTLLSSEFRSVLIFTAKICISVIQMIVGFCGITNAMKLLIIECGLTLFMTVLDIINDIAAASIKQKEDEAKSASNVVVKSLKHFPRQWNRLQLVNKESLLEMNLVSSDGFAPTPSFSSLPNASSSATLDGTDSQFAVEVDIRKLIESEVLRSGKEATHYDGLILRKQKSVSGLFRGPSLRILPVSQANTNRIVDKIVEVDEPVSKGSIVVPVVEKMNDQVFAFEKEQSDLPCKIISESNIC